MIITNSIAKSKISRDIKDGKLFKIITGLYENDPNTPGHLLAGKIHAILCRGWKTIYKEC